MKTSGPPRAAAWLLDHLVPGSMNDALAGDLAEEFGRRGAAWYWRQVMLAIAIGFLRHIRSECVSIGFSFVWIYASEEFIRRSGKWWFGDWWQAAWWIRLPWPWSLVVEVTHGILDALIPLALGLAAYLIAARRFSFRGFSTGIATMVGSLIVYDVAMTFLRGNGYRLPWSLTAMIYPVVLVSAIWTGQRRRHLRSSLS
jgi:hypothetical protein